MSAGTVSLLSTTGSRRPVAVRALAISLGVLTVGALWSLALLGVAWAIF